MVEKITNFLAAIVYHSVMLYFKIRYRSKWRDAVREHFFKEQEQPTYNFVTDKTYSSESYNDYALNTLLAAQFIDGGMLVKTEKHGYLMINPEKLRKEVKGHVDRAN